MNDQEHIVHYQQSCQQLSRRKQCGKSFYFLIVTVQMLSYYDHCKACQNREVFNFALPAQYAYKSKYFGNYAGIFIADRSRTWQRKRNFAKVDEEQMNKIFVFNCILVGFPGLERLVVRLKFFGAENQQLHQQNIYIHDITYLGLKLELSPVPSLRPPPFQIYTYMGFCQYFVYHNKLCMYDRNCEGIQIHLLVCNFQF
eukprot:TRINITY_DN6596_c1_g1_i6.p2 TRINITY_DN6596_c1_g1~~TRINITY_DN6596_c1_g1_i6.p2  ORF type:complete len:199 (-),score=-5.59 TRINITY_DN6596_c1_g1_i6:569-1165(-)